MAGIRWGLWIAAWMLVVGCKPTMLPDSTVENTAENREIAEVVEAYRKALESRDTSNVLKLVSAEYFEDAGTADPTDDYNFNGLKQHLDEDLTKIQAVRVTVRLLRVDVDGDRAYADYRFQTRALVGFPAGDQWVTRTDDNRLSFRREGGRWMIVAGL
jgi:ketosteroid isomerase-like protein